MQWYCTLAFRTWQRKFLISVRLEGAGLLAEPECTAMQTFYPQRNVNHISQHDPRLLALDKLVGQVKHSFTVGRKHYKSEKS